MTFFQSWKWFENLKSNDTINKSNNGNGSDPRLEQIRTVIEGRKVEGNKRKTNMDESELDDGRRIWKAGRIGPTARWVVEDQRKKRVRIAMNRLEHVDDCVHFLRTSRGAWRTWVSNCIITTPCLNKVDRYGPPASSMLETDTTTARR